MIKNVYWSSCKIPAILFRIQLNLNFSQQIFEKSSNAKFHENPSSESRVVPCGRKDGRTNMTKLKAVFRNFPYAPNKLFCPLQIGRPSRLPIYVRKPQNITMAYLSTWRTEYYNTIITNLMHWLLFIRKILLSSSITWPLTYLQSDGTICCMYTTVYSWRWALDARNM